jgi:hypothetical protein
MKKLIIFISSLFVFFTGNTQVITRFAGSSSTSGFSGDGGIATGALMNTPFGICADAVGNIYITDHSDYRVRKVDPTGIITTFAGTGTSGYTGDGIQATAAELFNPAGVCADASGNIYIAEGYRIRKVNSLGIISTYAGTGVGVHSGDGGPATAAGINLPCGISLDGSGNMYVAEFEGNTVRKIDAGGIITTIAGTGAAGYSGNGLAATVAQLHYPKFVRMDGIGNIYFSDWANNCVRVINSSGIINNFAGTGVVGFFGDGGPATSAKLNSPTGIQIDPSGNVYIFDETNYRLRMVNTSGIISTFAGTGTGGDTGDGGPVTLAELIGEGGLCADGSSNIYITTASEVRKICNPPAAATITGSVTLCASDTISLSASTPGGTWGYTNTHAVVPPTAGDVTGVSDGIDTITYSLSNTCYFTTTSFPVTVNPLPDAGTITGMATLCSGTTTTLADTAAGGIWSNSTAVTGSIDGTGIYTGAATGADTVTYTVTNGCGTATTTDTLQVLAAPVVSHIAGATSVCADSSITLTDTVSGGIWSSSLPGSINSTGLFTAHAAGRDTVIYTLTNMCGTDTATKIVSVTVCDTAAGVPSAPVLAKGGVNVWPNPACMTLNFEFSASGNVNIKLMDVTGRVLDERVINTGSTATFDVRSYPEGLYLYQVITAGNTQSGKFIVQ